jgi:hypothetical protein
MNDTSYRARTRLVHAGQRRSHYGETSEAIYLTQGFVYPDAEAAETRFKGELAEGEEGFIYSRYGNPTVAMFEDRIAALEGAEARRGRCSARVFTSSRPCVRALASASRWSMAPTWPGGARRCGRRPRCASSRRHRTRRWRSSM